MAAVPGLLGALETIREQYDHPPSDMEIIRQALYDRVRGVNTPQLFNDEQREVFVGKLDLLTEFLESEDGADSVELLVNTFARFVEDRE